MSRQAALVIESEAEDDLLQLYLARLAQRGPDGADGAEALLETLMATIESLADFPERGPVPPELEALGERNWRQISKPPYRIIYEYEDDIVTIVLVADSRRDFASLLQRRLLQR